MKKARTVASDLDIHWSEVLELADRVGGSEHTLVDPAQVELALKEREANQPEPKAQAVKSKNPKPIKVNGFEGLAAHVDRFAEEPATDLVKVETEAQRRAAARSWIVVAMAADEAIREGNLFQPQYEKAGATGLKYRDPLDSLLDATECRWGRKPNDIVVSVAEIEQCENEGKHFRWRSNEFLRKFERQLVILTGEHRACKGCGEVLSHGFREEVKKLLRQELFLPGTPKVDRKKIIRIPDYHEICLDLARGYRDLKVTAKRMQTQRGMRDSDPEMVAYRNKGCVELLGRVLVKHEPEGATRSEIIVKFRAMLPKRKGGK